MAIKKSFIFILSLLMIFTFALGGLCEAKSKKTKWNMSAYFPAKNPFYKYFFVLPAETVEKAIGGTVDIKIYPANSLVAGKDLYQSLQTGTVGIGWVFSAFVPGVFPLNGLFSLPGLFPNQATSNAVLNALFEKYPQFKKQFSPRVEHIISEVHMRADIHSRVPIRSLAELKGKVIACQDPKIAEALQAMGAAVSVMKLAEIYTALERKVVDGVACAWGAVAALRFYEVAKYHTLIGICPATSHWLINRKAWDKLTPLQQTNIKLAGPGLQNWIMIANVNASMFVRTKLCTPEKGHEMIELSPQDMKKMRSLFRPMWNKWAEEIEKKGYPGKAILKDAEKLIDGYVYG